jgi:hypothetical protein
MTATHACLPIDAFEAWRPCPLTRGEAALAYPLLLALENRTEPLAEWQARVRRWLGGSCGERGIMTLRNPGGVITAVLFFAVMAEGAASPILVVPFLRIVEPVGGWHVLKAVLRLATVMACERACSGVLLRGEPGSGPWVQIASGLEAIGRASRYVRRGEDWFRPLEDGATVVSLPSARW